MLEAKKVRDAFFLGGYDLEMLEIRRLIENHAPNATLYDKHLSWGAAASAYADEIRNELARHARVILVELENDLALDIQVANKEPGAGQAVAVDHHGDRAGETAPTSLEQISAILQIDPADLSGDERRRMELVSANDRGHIPAMRSLHPPASIEEMQQIRAADRRAQGLTDQDEAAARVAIRAARQLAGGRLTIVETDRPNTSAVADFLQVELGGAGFQNLLVQTPIGVTFFGEGAVVKALVARFPEDSWYGGSLPQHGFWGTSRIGAAAARQAIVSFVGQE